MYVYRFNWQQNLESNVERVIYWFDSEIFEMWTYNLKHTWNPHVHQH